MVRGVGVERRVQPLEFRDPRFVRLRRMYVPHAFLGLLIEESAKRLTMTSSYLALS